MSLNLIVLFLGVSLVFYCLFGGADFGGGILQAFLSKEKRGEQRELITHAMAPVWEANHMWIILAVVILFNGFPKAFSAISITFHIPILIMLLGIILRGCSFTFSNYDAVKDRSQIYYSAIFIGSSFLTPLLLGMIAGGLFLGRIPSEPTSFSETYIFPWFNLFSISLGIFLCSLFAFLAAVYLVGESGDPFLKRLFSNRARAANIVAVISGAGVFFSAHLLNFPLLEKFLSHKLALACVILATLILGPLWSGLHRERLWWPRILAAGQMTLILLGWFSVQFPNLIMRNPDPLTIYNTSAPEITLHYLLYALVSGSFLIFPALIYLLKIFKE